MSEIRYVELWNKLKKNKKEDADEAEAYYLGGKRTFPEKTRLFK